MKETQAAPEEKLICRCGLGNGSAYVFSYVVNKTYYSVTQLELEVLV